MLTVTLALNALFFASLLLGVLFLTKADREGVIVAAMSGLLLALNLVALFS